MAGTDPISPESRRFPLRLPRPIWYGLAALALVVVAVGVHAFAKPVVPHFPNAAVYVADGDGHEMAWAGLQDPKGLGEINGFKFADEQIAIQIDWRLLRSSAAGDLYEFKIVTGSNVLPIVKRINVSIEPVELLKVGEVVVTIREKIFD